MTTGTSGSGANNPSGAPESTPGFIEVRVARNYPCDIFKLSLPTWKLIWNEYFGWLHVLTDDTTIFLHSLYTYKINKTYNLTHILFSIYFKHSDWNVQLRCLRQGWWIHLQNENEHFNVCMPNVHVLIHAIMK